MTAMRAAAAAVAVLAVFAAGPSPAQEGPQPVAVVEMTFGLKFQPAEVRIRAGQTVEWRNKGFFVHTVTFDPSKAADPSRVSLPAGVEPFDSGNVEGGKSWKHTFTTPGTYRYVCVPHEGHGMSGTVVVLPAAS